MKSHIQMPKCVLKEFAIQEGKFKGRCYSFDIASGIISRTAPKKVNTVQDFYSDDVEHIFSELIEMPLGNEIRNIKDNIDRGQVPIMDADAGKVFLNYLHALLSRSPMMLDSIRQNLTVGFLFSEQMKNDLAAVAYGKMDEQHVFCDFRPIYLLNKTTIPFVLPTCGFYFINTDKAHAVMHLPITENIGVLLIKSDEDTNEKFVVLLEDESKVRDMNNMAYRGQKIFKNAYLISSRKEALERIKEECAK